MDRKVWMIDGGSSTLQNIWDYRIRQYLLYEGIDRVDVLAVTHPDADHINALYDMLMDRRVSTKRLLLPEASYDDQSWDRIKAIAKERGIPVSVAAAGEVYDIGKGRIYCLHPSAEDESDDKNALSLVLELEWGDCFRGIFTGDLGIEQENEVIEEIRKLSGYEETGGQENMKINPNSKITFLKTGHHGSKYSTGEAFLEALNPKYASVSAGKNNRYGHPSPEALARLSEAGVMYRVTAWSGAVMLDVKGDKVAFHAFLED